VPWALWHWPLIVMGLYGNPVTPLWFRLLFFTLGIMSMSVVLTYLRLRTESLWPAVVFRMSHNVFLQRFFAPMTDQHARSAWWWMSSGRWCQCSLDCQRASTLGEWMVTCHA
jgi:membrane protease YdiL (CAAX protease family)